MWYANKELHIEEEVEDGLAISQGFTFFFFFLFGGVVESLQMLIKRKEVIALKNSISSALVAFPKGARRAGCS